MEKLRVIETARSPAGRRCRQSVLPLALCLVLATEAAAPAATPHGEDWPCVQRKMVTLSVGAMWQGPEINVEDTSWQNDPEIADLVKRTSQRRMTIEEAQKLIADFAQKARQNKEQQLAMLFNGIFQTISTERREIISGIERYTKGQRMRAEHVRKLSHEFASLQAKKDRTKEENERLAALQQQFEWDSRIYEEREQALEAVCESPIILEQRLYALARAIQSHL